MSNVPWFPRSYHEQTAGCSSNSRVEYELTGDTKKEKIGSPSVPPEKQIDVSMKQLMRQKIGSRPRMSTNQTNPYDKHRVRQWISEKDRRYVFTPEELAAKRQAAIEEEALKKVARDGIARKKIEERWIEVGRALCSVTPNDSAK